jgi:hypothetical protein
VIRWLKSLLWKKNGKDILHTGSRIKDMACQCYGYGRWDAPYWFIGPEQGIALSEDIEYRVDAWHALNKSELSDCREFHELIKEQRWHRQKPQLQKTWKQLILLLMVFKNKSTDNESRRLYQRDHWGMQNGETCVIELSGLPAHSYTKSKHQRVKLFPQGEFEKILERRINLIRERILENKPCLVVMYGLSEKKHFEKIAGQVFPSNGVMSLGSSTLALATHPVSFEGVKNRYWIELGKRLRHHSEPEAKSSEPTVPSKANKTR